MSRVSSHLSSSASSPSWESALSSLPAAHRASVSETVARDVYLLSKLPPPAPPSRAYASGSGSALAPKEGLGAGSGAGAKSGDIASTISSMPRGNGEGGKFTAASRRWDSTASALTVLLCNSVRRAGAPPLAADATAAVKLAAELEAAGLVGAYRAALAKALARRLGGVPGLSGSAGAADAGWASNAKNFNAAGKGFVGGELLAAMGEVVKGGVKATFVNKVQVALEEDIDLDAILAAAAEEMD